MAVRVWRRSSAYGGPTVRLCSALPKFGSQSLTKYFVNFLQLITVPKARIENFRFRRFSIPAKELFISHSVLLRLTWNQARSSGIIHPQLVREPYLQKYHLFDRLHNPTSSARFLSTTLRSYPKCLYFCEKRPSHVWKIVIESEILLWPTKMSTMR